MGLEELDMEGMLKKCAEYCEKHTCLRYDNRVRKGVIFEGIDQPTSGNCEINNLCLGPTEGEDDGKMIPVLYDIEEAYKRINR